MLGNFIECFLCGLMGFVDLDERFKSTPTLVTQFAARRLPRAFLVLLEGLLNVVPTGRPSCDRVASAIREGRVSHFPSPLFCDVFLRT
jgi:hypothetical protein